MSNVELDAISNAMPNAMPEVTSEASFLKTIAPFMADGVSMNEDAQTFSNGQVITTDMLVEGTHFDLTYCTLFDVGWKAMAVNLSDLAAMFATPTAITVALGVPSSMGARHIQQLYEGMQACLEKCAQLLTLPSSHFIVGGDTVSAPQLTLSVTAIGQRDEWLRNSAHGLRSSARVGDRVILHGASGLSALGLGVLKSGPLQHEFEGFEAAKHQHQRPALNAHASASLRHQLQKMSKKNVKACALMDTSDGLADAVLKISAASGVSLQLNEDALHLHDEIAHAFSEEHHQLFLPFQSPLEMMLYGGEDFGLLATLPPSIDIPDGFIDIGRVIQAEEPCSVVLSHGTIQVLSSDKTFQHFASEKNNQLIKGTTP